MSNKEFKLDRAVAAEYLSGDKAYMSTIMAILYSEMGDHVYETSTDLLFKEIEEAFSCKLSEETENKINAAIVLLTTDKFFIDKTAFTAVTLAINEGDIGSIPEGGEEDINGFMVMWAMFEASLLGDDTLDELLKMLASDVRKYADEKIAEMAEDKSDIPDSIDTLKEAMDSNAFMDYLKRNIFELAKQLEAIGANRETLKDFLADNGIKVEIV